MIVYLGVNYAISNEDKEDAFGNKRGNSKIHVKNPENLFQTYFSRIINGEGLSGFRNYNELTYENYIQYVNLFLDIDVHKESCPGAFDEFSVLTNVVRKFINYIYNKTSISNIMSYEDFCQETWSNIGVTKSTNPNKYSYHIFFNNVTYNIANTDILRTVKGLIGGFKLETAMIKKSSKINMAFVASIDEQVYRKNTSLRVIFCSKEENNGKPNYHYPLTVNAYSKLITPFPFEDLDENNIKNYFFTILNSSGLRELIPKINNSENGVKDMPKSNVGRLLSVSRNINMGESSNTNCKQVDLTDEDLEAAKNEIINNPDSVRDVQNFIEENSLPADPRVLDIEARSGLLSERVKKLIEFQLLTPQKIYNRCFMLGNKLQMENTNFLKNYEYYTRNNVLTYEELTKLYLEFNYDSGSCMFCDKPYHKNIHVFNFLPSGFMIYKLGRKENCRTTVFSYRNLSLFEICSVMFKFNFVKRLPKNNLALFFNRRGWKIITEANDYSEFKNLLLEEDNVRYFKEADVKTIISSSETKIRDVVNTLIKNLDIQKNPEPYLFQFRNGVLDIKENKFIPIQQTKNYFASHYVNYDYKTEEEYTEEEKHFDDFLKNTVIGRIMPEFINGEPNPHRRIFENNLATCIIAKNKPVITIFSGPTSAGKSTIKRLLETTLENNFTELPSNTYISYVQPNTPNPWMGNIEGKLISFGSETAKMDKFNSQSIKLMTENIILGRRLHENSTGQLNLLTQFIDTNHEPEVDESDLAVFKRLAIVRFQSFFAKNENKNIFLDFDKNLTKYEHNNDLNFMIVSGKMKIQMFNILRSWVHKYKHHENINILGTEYLFETYQINNVLDKILVSSTLIQGLEYIKEECKSKYYEYKIEHPSKITAKLVSYHAEYLLDDFRSLFNLHGWKKNPSLTMASVVYKYRSLELYCFVCVGDIKEEYKEEINKKALAIKKTFDFDTSLSAYKEILNLDC